MVKNYFKKIYHKYKKQKVIEPQKGDFGETYLFDGTKVLKSDSIIQFVGLVEELNSIFGIVISNIKKTHSQELQPDLEVLLDIQKDLYILQNMAMGDHLAFNMIEEIKNLEETIKDYENLIDDLTKEILPGGCVVSSYLYLAFSVSRKIEREITSYNSKSILKILPYFNRLSDLLFLIARFINTQLNTTEYTIKKGR